mmetsp:Transcript_10172/g.42198  ORF Transcript_10172/g.42198 Transcript_10172/m.42198 type:complete len:201 (-) Transcript_10172:327-929(-)
MPKKMPTRSRRDSTCTVLSSPHSQRRLHGIPNSALPRCSAAEAVNMRQFPTPNASAPATCSRVREMRARDKLARAASGTAAWCSMPRRCGACCGCRVPPPVSPSPAPLRSSSPSPSPSLSISARSRSELCAWIFWSVAASCVAAYTRIASVAWRERSMSLMLRVRRRPLWAQNTRLGWRMARASCAAGDRRLIAVAPVHV